MIYTAASKEANTQQMRWKLAEPQTIIKTSEKYQMSGKHFIGIFANVIPVLK